MRDPSRGFAGDADTGEDPTKALPPMLTDRRKPEPLPELTCRFDLADTIVAVSPAYAAYYQCEPDDLIGCRLEDLGPGSLRRDVSSALERSRHLSFDSPVQSREGESSDHWGRPQWVRWTELAVFDDNKRSRGFELSGRDITQERLAAQDVEYQASFDPSTGVLNNKAFWARTQQAAQQSRLRGNHFGVLVADIATVVNLADKAQAGSSDRIREEVAERIKSTFRSTDFVGRIADERFAILCPDLGDEQVIGALVQRLEYVVGEPMVGLENIRVRTSCAWVLANGHDSTAALLQDLDAQLVSSEPSNA